MESLPSSFEYVKTLFGKILDDVANWLPSLVGAIILLILGWFVAILAKKIVGGLLRRLGLDNLSQRVGIAKAMENWGFLSPLSRIIGRFVFWVVLLVFVLATAESMGFKAVADIFRTLLAYFPKILSALLILLLGGFFSGVIGDAVGAVAEKSGLKTSAFLGATVKYVLLLIVAVVVLQELGVETSLLSNVIVSLVAACAVALALAFGLGSRELARNIMAGFHARETFLVGSRVRIKEHTGRLIHIGTYKFIVETDGGQISLPNHVLTDEEVILLPESGDL